MGHRGILGVIISLFLGAAIFLGGSGVAPNMIPEMPTHDSGMVVSGTAPQELRDQSVYRWMSCSCRIENKQTHGSVFGSGTLCYYDRKDNTAYIVSCGHLFNGGERTMFIDFWYKNKVKLTNPARFTADVVAYDKYEDIAFFKFKPDWVPEEYFPIAALDAKIESGSYLWSAGCDGGREVATYKVKVVDPLSDSFLVTRENSPRHGRSGGGLMNDAGYYVGICVRSSDPYNGTGTGLFVPLTRIHAYCQKAKLNYLLNLPKVQPGGLQDMPIIDRIGAQGNYPKDYIPIP